MDPDDIDFTALQALGWPWPGAPADPAWARALAGHPGAVPARVVEQHRTGYAVAGGADQALRVESPAAWQRPRFPAHERAAVGDWVLVAGGSIVALLPRRSAIKRGAAGEHYHQQVIAANVDTVFVVTGLDDDFNPRRLERYLLLVGSGGAEPVIVLTKADLGADAAAALAQVAGLGVAARALDARDPAAVQAALAPWLGPGRTIALVGSSGVGKSTLTNTLLGEQRMRTAAVRRGDSRGRHTTTHRALLALADGSCLIDTPGMRELKPTGEETLADGGFEDIEALAAQCRFRDCAHQGEPGCAVQAAIAAGSLAPARLASYRKLRAELDAAARKLAQRQEEAAAAPRGRGRRR
ncbi:ribosome small subunit-dependent GTPase A [Xanthomonas massiliensis]|uniref:ribosome small subunit-dependent GTPase A n=1 Tax=Xanthomonas massiliensis TaxID=1720302 RepID=UPI0008257E37|nr:ribosome small subunit-dependent GTPase A [Xanthomonas massiliensis]